MIGCAKRRQNFDNLGNCFRLSKGIFNCGQHFRIAPNIQLRYGSQFYWFDGLISQAEHIAKTLQQIFMPSEAYSKT
jgi:hypothetical protein